MTINRIPSSGLAEGVRPAEGAKESFGKLLEQAARGPENPASGDAMPQAQVEGTLRAQSSTAAVGGRSEVSSLTPAATVESPPLAQAVKMVEEVNGAQQRLDQILALAESGKTFSPAELLAFQAHVYRASQELDLAGKVVEKATSGVKQLLQTQL